MAPYGSIMAVAPLAHAGIQVVLAKEHFPLAAGELRSLVGMDHHLGLGFAPPDGREQGLQGKLGCHPRLGGRSDDAPREQVDHDRQIQAAFVGPGVGDVGHPDLVGRINLELPVQGVGRDHDRLASYLPGRCL